MEAVAEEPSAAPETKVSNLTLKLIWLERAGAVNVGVRSWIIGNAAKEP